MKFDHEISVDALVVGGGPAGAACAFALGKKGIDTIMIDKKEMDQIGNKVCGDALAPAITKQAEDMIGLHRPSKEKGELMELCDSSILLGKSPGAQIVLGHQTSTVDRLRYGQALLQELEPFENVRIMAETRVRDVIVENQTLKGLYTISKEGTIKFNTKIIVDASGSSGVVRSRLPEEMCSKFPKKIPKHEMIVAYREIIQVEEDHDYQKSLYLTFEPEMAETMPGYYWIFSRGKREMNIGLGWLMLQQNVGKNIREINEKIRKRKFPNAKVLASQGDQIPARLPLPSLVHNGFIAAGDAGALANPLNGEGHGPALISGIKAAETIEEALKAKDYSEKGLWSYNQWIWNEYGALFSIGIAVIKFINKYSFEAFDWIMKRGILQEDDIIEMLDGSSQNLQIVRRALKGWYKPKLLWGLRKTVKYAEMLENHARNYPNYENFENWGTRLKELESIKF